MTIQIPPAARQVIQQLNDHGYEAFVVGGCVRDALLGKTPQDWDICTQAMPDEILLCFADFRTIPTGLEHGTVTVLVDHIPMEVTSYRIDGSYSDCRHPDGVTFTRSLKEDLARRDFTVNAMAYHPQYGLVDLYGGKKDLEKQVLRCVGEAQLRFREDALRILRGFRFAAQLGFVLEQTTERAARDNICLLSNVAMERIYQELSKLLCGADAARVLQQYPTVMQAVIPHMQPITDRQIQAFSHLPVDVALRFGMLYRNNSDALVGMRALRAPKAVAEQVAFLAALGSVALPSDLAGLQKAVYRFGMQKVTLLAQFQLALSIVDEDVIANLQQIEERELCCSLKDLAISGKDLKQAGFSDGKSMGDTLQTLLFAVIDQQVANEKEALLSLASMLTKE